MNIRLNAEQKKLVEEAIGSVSLPGDSREKKVCASAVEALICKFGVNAGVELESARSLGPGIMRSIYEGHANLWTQAVEDIREWWDGLEDD